MENGVIIKVKSVNGEEENRMELKYRNDDRCEVSMSRNEAFISFTKWNLFFNKEDINVLKLDQTSVTFGHISGKMLVT